MCKYYTCGITLFCSKGGKILELKNKLNEVPLAKVKDDELKEIKDLERQFGDQYYLIAFDKSDMK